MSLTAIDYEKIRLVIGKYSQCLDLQDTEGFASCFTPNGVFQILEPPKELAPGLHRGHAELKEFRETHGLRKAGNRTRHHVTNCYIEEDGDGARAVTYVLTTRGGGGQPFSIGTTGIYFDRFVRNGNEWLISERRFRSDPQPEPMDRMSGLPLPLAQSNVGT